MFETLLKLLANPSIEQTTKIPIVDNLFGFLSDKEDIKLAQQWLDAGIIFHDPTTKHELFKLGTKHKYSILKKIFEEPSISTEHKHELLEKIIGDDKSDIAQNSKETCMALLPSAESKAQIWASITDVNSTESIYKRAAKMGGFYSWK
jgi:F0F1-type ATP synthase delta subunit